MDTASKRAREVLSAREGDVNPYFDLSWDGRTIVYSLKSMETDIWIMTAGR